MMSERFDLARDFPPASLPEAHEGTLAEPAAYVGASMSARDFASLPDEVEARFDQEREEALNLLGGVTAGLPPGNEASLLHLAALRRAYAEASADFPAAYARDQNAVRAALSRIVSLAAALNEWHLEDRGRLTMTGWDDPYPMNVVRDVPSLALLIYDSALVYGSAVYRPHDRDRVNDGLRVLWDGYGFGRAEQTWECYEALDACREVLRLLPDLARTLDSARTSRLGIAVAAHLTAILTAGGSLGALTSPEWERGRISADRFAFDARVVQCRDDGQTWPAAYETVAAWAGGSPHPNAKAYETWRGNQAKIKAKQKAERQTPR